MLTTYRRVLSLPGALAFSGAGLVARLPISMVSLGIVVLVSTRTGSYGAAGAVSASYLLANALMAVPLARLVDRLGQRLVLPPALLVFALGMGLMMTAVEAGWDAPYPHAFAALGGAAMPQIGSCVRARWSYLLSDRPGRPERRDLQTAFAIEAVADEAVFMVGPALVTALATLVHPLAGLVAAVVSALAGTATLVAQRSTEPPATGSSVRAGGHGPMGWPVLAPVTLASLALGTLFGATEVATVAFAEELGRTSLSGPLLAVFALGSLLAGIAVGALHVRAGHATRFRRSLLALSLLLLPLPFVEGFTVMGVLLLLAGLAISPTLIAAVALVQETVPAARITEGIAIVTTGLAAGVAPGAVVVGHVVDRYGASAGYWVPALSGLAGAAVALTIERPRPGRPPRPAPEGTSPTGSPA